MNLTIKELLSSLSITGKYKGYQFTIIACELILEDEMRLYSVAKDLYPIVAERCNCNYTYINSIERNIRTVMFKAWDNSRDRFLEIAGYDMEEPPTTTQFLGILVSYIQRRKL